MFQVIAVDDEAASLRRMERLLSAEPQISHYELFDNAEDALAYAEKHEINLALLDMEMPETNGLTLAQELQDIYPNLDIIFITAYNQYAIDAFKVHASGYLLKPISSNDFKHELEILLARHTPIDTTVGSDKLVVSCFGAFTCRVKSTGEMVRFRTVKAEELFLLLLDSKDCMRSKDYLLDTLWPDVGDPEKAGNNFRVTCSYLRKAFADLGFPDILMRSKEDYYLNLEKIECDLFDLRIALDRIDSMSYTELKQITKSGKGPYLENKFYDWADESKTWLDKNIQRILNRTYELAMSEKDYEEAENKLQNMLALDPYNEHTAELYIHLKLLLHCNQQARDFYQEFSNRMVKDLQVIPSDNLKKLIDNI